MHYYDHVKENDIQNVDDVPALLDVFCTLLIELNEFDEKVGGKSN
jgi:hypothetical protein